MSDKATPDLLLCLPAVGRERCFKGNAVAWLTHLQTRSWTFSCCWTAASATAMLMRIRQPCRLQQGDSDQPLFCIMYVQNRTEMELDSVSFHARCQRWASVSFSPSRPLEGLCQ